MECLPSPDRADGGSPLESLEQSRRRIDELTRRLDACEQELQEKNRALASAWRESVRRGGGAVALRWRPILQRQAGRRGTVTRVTGFVTRLRRWARREHRYLLGQAWRLLLGRRKAFAAERERHRQRLLVRRSGLFDEAWFRARYPEIESPDLLGYFLERGTAEQLSPGPYFDTREYLSSVDEQVSVNPLIHYLESHHS